MLFISLLSPPDQTQAGKSEPLRQLEEGKEMVDGEVEEEEEEEGQAGGGKKDQGREGESETFSWEKINIRSHLILLLPLLHPLPPSPSSPYLNVKPNLACGFYIFYGVMSFISCAGAAAKLFRIAALIGHTDSPCEDEFKPQI